MPDLNWELWRLRLSDEVARHLRREAALAAERESQPLWSIFVEEDKKAELIRRVKFLKERSKPVLYTPDESSIKEIAAILSMIVEELAKR